MSVLEKERERELHLFRYKQLCTPRFVYSSVAEGEAEAKPKATAAVLDVLDQLYSHLVLQHIPADRDAAAIPRQ